MMSPIIYWVRRDFRMADNPALSAAVATGQPVIPVFILDSVTDGIGAAAKWRLGRAIASFADTLAASGSRLILRKGEAAEVLRALVAQTGAAGVLWGRVYEPNANARDANVKTALRGAGLVANAHPGHLLFEPWTVATESNGFYRVYSPFRRAVEGRDPGAVLAAAQRLTAPGHWPDSEDLADWSMAAAMHRGADIVAPHATVGEAAARRRLDAFLDQPVADYAAARDRLDIAGTSGLSENLTVGEIGPRTVWHAAKHALAQGKAGAETFIRELIWREFSYHLLHHTPHIATDHWKPEWNDFPWTGDSALSRAWEQGRTGVQLVDAAMREMYVTGRMHNRARMVAGSYLTKHLMTDWRVGQRWFADCLIDWDPAANAMGWQWVAGSGPDAAPYFRIFNPDTQAEKFDPDAVYRHRWIAELSVDPPDTALDYFRAVPESWNMRPDEVYPAPVVSLGDGRQRALAAFEARGQDRSAATVPPRKRSANTKPK